VQRPALSELFTLLLVYITNTPLPENWVAGALVIALLIVMGGLVQTIRSLSKSATRDGLWLLYLSFTPSMLLFLFSQWRPVYIERALLPSGAIFCIWLAWVIRKTGLPRVAQYALICLLGISSVLGISQHLSYRDFPYGPFQELDISLRENMESQDVILHSNKLSLIPAILFDRRLPQTFMGDEPGSRTDTLAPATQQVLEIQAEKDIYSATDGATRVWYIIYERSIAEYQAAGHQTHPDIEYLDSYFNLKSTESWNGLQVFLYSRKP